MKFKKWPSNDKFGIINNNFRVMQRKMIICVTGACGKIAYSLLHPLCSGQIYGHYVAIQLRLLDLATKRQDLRILRQQLEDCCYQNVEDVTIYDEKDQEKPFSECDLVIFLGGMPRRPGMERQDVFEINAEIFQQQGKHLDKVAKKTCKSLVVANPACTNCLVLARNAPSLPAANFTALTRLDYNRFAGQLGRLFDCKPSQLKNVVVWGNHSTKQLCDPSHLEIEGWSAQLIAKKLEEADLNKVTKTMYQRGGFIVQKQSGNAYMSATKAIVDHLKDWYLGSKQLVSMGVILSTEYYGLPQGLCFSMPTKCHGAGQYQIVSDMALTSEQKQRINDSRDQLLKEKNFVSDYLTNE